MMARLLIMVPTAILTMRGAFAVDETLKTWSANDWSAHLIDIRRKRSTGPDTPRELPEAPLSTTTAALLLFLPLIIHWTLLILLYARLNIVTFWRLSVKDKVLHLMSNTLLTLPVRKSKKEEQVHKAREIFWSLVLVELNLIGTALVTTALVNFDVQQNQDSVNESRVTQTRFLFHFENIVPFVNSDGYIVNYKRAVYTIPNFFLCFGLPSLFCHLAGSLLLLLQYKLVHPWRHLGKKREANFWGKLGGSKRGLDVEMSPWKSGGAVSYDERFCLIAIFVRILKERIQRLLLNMRSLVPKRGKCNKKTASKMPWR